MSKNADPPDHAELERRFALLRMPYVTVADVLSNFQLILSDQLNYEVSIDFVRFEQGLPRFPFVLGYNQKKFALIMSDVRKGEDASQFGREKVRQLNEGRDAKPIRPLETSAAKDINRWWSTGHNESDGNIDEQVDLLAAIFQLVFSNPEVGSFGVPNRLYKHAENATKPYLVRLDNSAADLLPPAWFASLANSAPEWEGPYDQFMGAEENRKAYDIDGRPIYQWIKVILDLSEAKQRAIDSPRDYNLYVPIHVFGRFQGYLVVGMRGAQSDEAAWTDAAALAAVLFETSKDWKRTDVFRRLVSELDGAWSEGVRQLARDDLRYLGSDEEGWEQDADALRVAPSVPQTIELWSDMLVQHLGWKFGNGTCETWTRQNGTIEVNVRGLAEFHLRRLGADAGRTEGFNGPTFLNWAISAETNAEEGSATFLNERALSASKFLGDLLALRQRLEAEQLRLRWARRNASATVMARNLSHNIGSHVLWHIRETLVASASPSAGPAKPTDTEMEAFLSYLQQRMDFIAQMARGGPAWGMTMTAESLFWEVVRQKALWENIARSDIGNTDVRFRLLVPELDYAFGHREWSHESWTGATNLASPLSAILRVEKEGELQPLNAHWKDLRACEIEVPHYFVGAQALHVILENIVRNAARHGEPREPERDIVITIRIAQPEDARGFYSIQISDSRKTTEDQLRKIDAALQDPLILETGEPAGTNYGIKEMKLAAAFLRLAAVETLADKPENLSPPLLRATRDPEEHLTYSLHVKRRPLALLVGCAVHTDWRFDCFDNIDALENALNGGVAYSHEFLALSGDIATAKRIMLRFGARLPARVIWVTKNGEPTGTPPAWARLAEARLISALTQPNPQHWRKEFWEVWVRERWPNANLVVQWNEIASLDRGDHFTVANLNDRIEDESLVLHHGDHAGDPCSLDHVVERCPSFFSSFRSGEGESAILREMPSAPWLACLLTEMAATTVQIADERVWEHRGAASGCGCVKHRTLQAAWAIRGVTISDPTDFWNSRKLNGTYRPDFLVVHRGVLEKHPFGMMHAVNSLTSMVPRLVVVTGRGAMDLPDDIDVPVLEASNLAHVVVAQRDSKLPLVQLLYSLRSQPTRRKE